MCAKVLQNIENTKNLSENIVFWMKKSLFRVLYTTFLHKK